MANKKILIVAMSQSIHVVRWISQFSNQGWDIHLFPSVDDGTVHSELKDVTVYHSFWGFYKADPSVKRKGVHIPSIRYVNILEPLFRTRANRSSAYRANQLRRLIQTLKPDLIHVIEFQHAGYLFLEAYQQLEEPVPPIILTNWGNDIFLFGQLKAHQDKVRALVQLADYYDCECERDIELARELGMTAQAWPVFPNAGGLDLEKASKLRQPLAARKTIMLKGYQGWQGRALFALRAIELCVDVLQGYQVTIYSTGEDVVIAAELVSKRTGIPIEIVRNASHEEILRRFGAARIYLCANITDGASTSMLEAIAMGAFPIQSNTACADEWIQHGETGFIIEPEDVDNIAAALRRALTDDDLVERAAETNAKVAAERLDYHKIKALAIQLYQDVMSR